MEELKTGNGTDAYCFWSARRVKQGRLRILRENHYVCFLVREETAAAISDPLLLLEFDSGKKYTNALQDRNGSLTGDFMYITSTGIAPHNN